MRIVSLLPAATEIACALGLADSLVGVSHDCDHPPEICHLPRVTSTRFPEGLTSEEIHRTVRGSITRRESLYSVDIGKLAALQPDLVLAQRQCSVCAVGEADAARALGLAGVSANLWALEASRFREMPDDIQRLGEATRHETRAQALIGQLNARLDQVRRETSRASRPRVFCLSWFNPLMAAGHWETEMVELAGGEDGLGMRGETSNPLGLEKLKAYAPEVILLMPCGFTQKRTREEWEAVRHQPLWRNLPAVQSGMVFIVDGSLFHRPGPRLIDGVELLASLLHPEIGINARHQASAQKVA